MSMSTLAISCLTTFNLPWFMDLTFQVPMQYCSLSHQTLLPWPLTSRTGHCFCICAISSFFLELFLHSILSTYWPWEFIFQYHIFAFHTVHGILKTRMLKWSAIPFSTNTQTKRIQWMWCHRVVWYHKEWMWCHMKFIWCHTYCGCDIIHQWGLYDG